MLEASEVEKAFWLAVVHHQLGALGFLPVCYFTNWVPALSTSDSLAAVAATAIPDVPNLPFLRDSVLRFVMTIGIGGLPFAFLGAGLSVPGLLQAALIQVMLLFDPDASTAQTIRARCLACSRHV